MTRKDFELIAATLRRLGEDNALCFDSTDDRDTIARVFANELSHTNPNFNRDRFIKAALPERTA